VTTNSDLDGNPNCTNYFHSEPEHLCGIYDSSTGNWQLATASGVFHLRRQQAQFIYTHLKLIYVWQKATAQRTHCSSVSCIFNLVAASRFMCLSPTHWGTCPNVYRKCVFNEFSHLVPCFPLPLGGNASAGQGTINVACGK